MQPIKSIGIVGAGTMGQGIAQLCSMRGFDVMLYDINEEIILRGIDLIHDGLDEAALKGKLSEQDKQQTIQRITSQPKLSELKADLLIEAAVEKLDIKRKIFEELEAANSADAILVTNTSSIPVTQIATVLKKPSRFAGLHFFNPAPIMKLVEIINSDSTSHETIEALRDFSNKLKKVSVLAKDSPGFIVNRVARHFYVESLKVLEENVADVNGIDALMRSTGFRMGPFELMDLIGVDTNFSVTTSIYEAFHQDGKFRPSRIQQQKVDAGHHGKKSGKGFYDYNQ